MSSRIHPIVDAVLSGKKTALAYVDEALEKAAAASGYHTTLALIAERAKTRAGEIDAAVAAGTMSGRLAGVPFLAKDNMLAYGAPTTAAAIILENFQAPFQAEAIERLEAEGAICIGKTNLDAFAHGGSTENSAYGPTKNPHDPARVPGGSSGGSAAAVALDIVPFALGTDTGGSIRQPASFCGVVGLKPTYGAVSRYGVVAMANSTDTIGVLSHSAEDAAVVMSVMAGQDSKDSTTLGDFFAPEDTVVPLRIGLIDECFGDGVEPEVASAVQATADQLASLGHQVDRVNLPSLPHALAVYYIVVPAEIASNLARYDGIKYGRTVPDATTLAETYERSRSQGFMPENQRRILIGNYVLSSGYYDAYYRKAQTVRTKIINEFSKAFEQYDVLLAPTAPTTAFSLGENTADPLAMYLADVMTVPASLAGLPAVSVPCGVDGRKLPIGLQLIGPQRSDARLLGLANQWEDSRGK